MKVQVDALQARIIAILKDWYPITFEELRDELSVSRSVLDRSLKGLMVKGIVALEPLSDKTFIRLLVPEIVLETDPKSRTKRRSKRKPSPEPDDYMMYR